MERRSLFRIFAAGAGAAACASRATASPAAVAPRPDAEGLLVDVSLCIGCRACVVACSNANSLTPPRDAEGLHLAPPSLSAKTKNIVKLYQGPDGQYAFVKQQCMQCVDPACVAGCPMSALLKGDRGIVRWNGDTCIGCRYCQIACPFNIPKFEWDQVNPEIVKCELCRTRLDEGKKPACVTVCPRAAVLHGKREELLATARKRIAEHPGKYFENRIYGETEGGGTQTLYISHVPFQAIGLPALTKESLPQKVAKVQETIYQGFLTPVIAYGAIAAVMKKRWTHHEEEIRKEEEETGMRGQL
ncbi:MAG TPA: hydrogenase 2 operon protein HybA [Solibacterales bacterium]|nr:hydrogenase 2 operon protein HybA [Bryobacterales bacterium]